jgi:capsular polysaccharide biosynthesis protein
MVEGEFDALDLVSYVRERWQVIAISCGVAVCLALGVSLMLHRKYTATATILIQAPGGADPRAATALSPVYLESLKSYEYFASSDNLFARALDAAHARESTTASIESLRRAVLQVSKPQGTAMLEISATLRDPQKAQALAQYIAEQTVALNRSMDLQSSVDVTNEFRTQFADARARYESAQRAHNAFAAAQPVESLENEFQESADLKFRLERDLGDARTELAGYSGQHPQSAEDQEWVRRQVESTQAKIASLEKQTRELAATLAKKGPELEARRVRRDALAENERVALGAMESANNKLNDMLTSVGFHGERLQVIDPGMVPQRPSSPDILLNVVAALLVSFIGSLVWLTFACSRARLLRVRSERVYSHNLR